MIVVQTVTPRMAEVCATLAREGRPIPVVITATRRPAPYFGADLAPAATAFAEACTLGSANSHTIHRAAEVLPAWVFTALVMACGMRMDVEKIEKAQRWPARSARLVVAIGLDELRRRGVLK